MGDNEDLTGSEWMKAEDWCKQDLHSLRIAPQETSDDAHVHWTPLNLQPMDHDDDGRVRSWLLVRTSPVLCH